MANFLGPELKIEKEFKKFGLDEYEIYDVLAYLIVKHGLKSITEELKNYLEDQAETLFTKLDFDAGGEVLVGLSAARALDVCAAMAEGLNHLADQYEI